LLYLSQEDYKDRYYEFMDRVLNLEIESEAFAKVIVDERTGTVVMGSDVRISTVAIAHGNLTIKITSSPQVSQPTEFPVDRPWSLLKQR